MRASSKVRSALRRFPKTLSSPAIFLFMALLAALWLQSKSSYSFGRGPLPYNSTMEGFGPFKFGSDSEFEVKSESDLPKGTPCVSKQNKPQTIFFFMNGCPHCDNVKPEWKKYATSATDVEIRQFEVSAAPNACSYYGVTGFPTFIQADSQGNVLSKERPF